jgi:hypothetical protein
MAIRKIRVKPIPKSAFDPDRPASSLLKSHVRALQAAVLEAIDTEREAAAQIRALTEALRELRPATTPQAERDAVRKRKQKQKRKPKRTGSARRAGKKR